MSWRSALLSSKCAVIAITVAVFLLLGVAATVGSERPYWAGLVAAALGYLIYAIIEATRTYFRIRKERRSNGPNSGRSSL